MSAKKRAIDVTPYFHATARLLFRLVVVPVAIAVGVAAGLWRWVTD